MVLPSGLSAHLKWIFTSQKSHTCLTRSERNPSPLSNIISCGGPNMQKMSTSSSASVMPSSVWIRFHQEYRLGPQSIMVKNFSSPRCVTSAARRCHTVSTERQPFSILTGWGLIEAHISQDRTADSASARVTEGNSFRPKYKVALTPL